MKNKDFTIGLLKDVPDDRDMLLDKYMTVKVLPSVISWKDRKIPILNQGRAPSCVGYSSARMKQIQEKIEHEKLFPFHGKWLYDECKKIDGIPNERGTYIRVALKILKKKGFKCYDIDSLFFKIKAYVKINNLHALKYAIATCGPLPVGVAVFKNWFRTRNGIIRQAAGDGTGGHAICVVGYDNNKELIEFANSWSSDWGDKGYGYLGYDYFRQYCMSAWAVVDLDDKTAKLDIVQLKADLKKI